MDQVAQVPCKGACLKTVYTTLQRTIHCYFRGKSEWQTSGLNMFVHNPLLLKTQLPGNETTWANYTGKEWKPFVIKTSDTEIERAIFPHNKLGLSLELYVDWNWSLDIPSPILWLFIFIYVKSKMQTNNIIVLLLFYLCLLDSAS